MTPPAVPSQTPSLGTPAIDVFYSFCWQVQLNMTKQSVDSQKTDELTAFMGLASEVKQGNVLLYGIEIDHSKVIFLMSYHYIC